MVLPSTVNGTEFGEQEWRDSLFLIYGIDPLNLPSHCDGCGEDFSIYHTMECKKGGLVTARHNELRDGVADVAVKTLTPAHMSNNPTIFVGLAV